MIRRTCTTGALALMTCLTAGSALAQAGSYDWPQWLGPDRSGCSRETGLLKSWPEGGPKLAWRAGGLGTGNSTPTVAAGRVYGMSYRGQDEVVWALDEKTGKGLWMVKIAPADYEIGQQAQDGSACSPAVDGDRLYVLGEGGDLVCLQNADGKVLWQKNLVRDFGGRVPSWGYSESPLVDGEKLIATPGGRQATMAALNKRTGAVIWTAQVPQGDGAHYASVVPAEVDGRRQYLALLSGGVVGISAKDGKFLWRYDHPANRTANCSSPIYRDHIVFAATGYNTGGGAAKLTTHPDGTVTAAELYFTRSMQNHHGGMVLVGDHIYGFNGNNLACINFKTGDLAWENRSVGKGSVTYADGCVYARSERGPVALVEANPMAYAEKGRFDQPFRSGKTAWPHPVIANGKLYLRDHDNLLCYDVRAK